MRATLYNRTLVAWCILLYTSTPIRPYTTVRSYPPPPVWRFAAGAGNRGLAQFGRHPILGEDPRFLERIAHLPRRPNLDQDPALPSRIAHRLYSLRRESLTESVRF